MGPKLFQKAHKAYGDGLGGSGNIWGKGTHLLFCYTSSQECFADKASQHLTDSDRPDPAIFLPEWC